MVARPEAVLAQLQRESVIKALDQLAEFWRRADAADRQLVLPHPPDHIQVDHRHCVGERRGRIVDVSLRPDQPGFFGAEGDEDKAAAKLAALAAEDAREFEQAGSPRSVVVRAVMNVRRIRREAALAAMSEMVVMGPDDDVFAL